MLYIITAAIWAIYAGLNQYEKHGIDNNLLICILINFAICPIAIIFAAIEKYSEIKLKEK